MSQLTNQGSVPNNVQSLQQVHGLSRSAAGGAEHIAVVRPRELALIKSRCIAEAKLLGEAAFYRWEVKDKNKSSGKSTVQGLSVQAAHMIARNWGNMHLVTTISETSAAMIFNSRVTDLETGYTVERPFRVDRRNLPQAQYQDGRALDIATQIGTSKAERNALLKMIPQYIQTEVLEVAQRDMQTRVEAEIQKHGQERVVAGYVKALLSVGVVEANILLRFGKAAYSELDVDDIVCMLCDWRSIKDGYDTPESAYPTPIHPVTTPAEEAPADAGGDELDQLSKEP